MTPEIADVLTAAIATLGVVVSAVAVAKINDTHKMVNSRLTELLALTRMAGREEGARAQREHDDEQEDPA